MRARVQVLMPLVSTFTKSTVHCIIVKPVRKSVVLRVREHEARGNEIWNTGKTLVKCGRSKGNEVRGQVLGSGVKRRGELDIDTLRADCLLMIVDLISTKVDQIRT